MSNWNEFVAQARANGAAAHELYMVLSTPADSSSKFKETLPEHLAYQRKLEELGVLFLAGPVSDETGDLMQGSGVIIYQAASYEEALGVAEADPMHANGARSFVLRRWMINEGVGRLLECSQSGLVSSK